MRFQLIIYVSWQWRRGGVRNRAVRGGVCLSVTVCQTPFLCGSSRDVSFTDAEVDAWLVTAVGSRTRSRWQRSCSGRRATKLEGVGEHFPKQKTNSNKFWEHATAKVLHTFHSNNTTTTQQSASFGSVFIRSSGVSGGLGTAGVVERSSRSRLVTTDEIARSRWVCGRSARRFWPF